MKKILILLYISIVLLSFFNCSSQNENKQLRFELKENLTCYPIDYPDLLGITMQLLKSDSMLLLNDFRGDSLIHVFNVANGRLLTKLFPVGNGPGEFISPLAIHINNNRLYVYYRQTATLYSMPLSSLLYKNKKITKHFQASGETQLLFPLSDSLFIASGLFPERYQLFNYWGEKVSEFGEYPAYWSREKAYPYQAKAMFHQTSFEKHPTDNLFLTYSNHTIEIYDYGKDNNYHPILIKSILLGEYNYSYIDDGNILMAEKGSDIERGIMSIACTSGYIYIVYNPNKTATDNYGSQIRIINWKGEPIKELNFDKGIKCLTVDEREEKAYLVVEDPDDSLMYFDMEKTFV